jgi:hypothetical protein
VSADTCISTQRAGMWAVLSHWCEHAAACYWCCCLCQHLASVFAPCSSWVCCRWRDILHLVDIVCCCLVLFPIVWSIKQLRDASGETKSDVPQQGARAKGSRLHLGLDGLQALRGVQLTRAAGGSLRSLHSLQAQRPTLTACLHTCLPACLPACLIIVWCRDGWQGGAHSGQAHAVPPVLYHGACACSSPGATLTSNGPP